MSFRLALVALLAGGAATAEEVMTLQWESGVIALKPENLSDVAVVKDGVMVLFTPKLAEGFTDLTGQLIGESMAIMVCGREIARPVIRARIEGGRLLVPARDPDATASVLSGTRPCAELPEDE